MALVTLSYSLQVFLLFILAKADEFMKNEGNDDDDKKVIVLIYSLYGLTAYIVQAALAFVTVVAQLSKTSDIVQC